LLRSIKISIILIGLILSPFVAENAFAQSGQSITIATEKESYAAGEPIEILGLVEIKLGNMQAIIQVFSPIGNMIDISQVEVKENGSFSDTVATSLGGVWKEDGTYIVKVTYGDNSAQTQFEYGGVVYAGVQGTPEFSMEEKDDNSQKIMLEDNTVDYNIFCAEVLGMTPDTENKSLIIEIKTSCDGELEVTLPKDVIDTDEEGFFILVDGDETNHDAISESESWTLIIPFSEGSEEIEIIGTYVIPEFGTIAVLILITAIASIIMISAKNKQIFYPKI